ncbi:cupin domain-containing protein [Clostridium magnum]|uniref:Cupin domain protein n=1 Tax=Clostridium magnum DSM 2767 TaxID=1121326 RepID=A0A162TK43_9CLOT|nr:cupin domain-containing protein [Clostridium magnum]KZL92747.1 cupin domain protein [Clostridium magnum DSM 2767]SHI24932.1 Cupin domain-containing protein [Clostridium magnum DSM 2767]
MEIIKLENLAKGLNPRGVTARKVFESEAVNIMNLLLKPGEKVDTHVTPVDVFFYVVSGKGKIEVGEESGVVSETDIVISPKNIPHAVYASEGENFEILVVKTPNPVKRS